LLTEVICFFTGKCKHGYRRDICTNNASVIFPQSCYLQLCGQVGLQQIAAAFGLLLGMRSTRD